MRVRILYDNMIKNLEKAWGFSCLVEINGENILFDTGGNPDILGRNMYALDIRAEDIGMVFLSHEHWDHIGGLPFILGKNSNLRVYALKSFSEELKSAIREKAELIEVSEPFHITENTLTTGELGDQIREQSLIAGKLLITGCAHPGIVEITRKAKELNPDVDTVMGGFHLTGSNKEMIGDVVSQIKALGVEYALPRHCSGFLATESFKLRFGETSPHEILG